MSFVSKIFQTPKVAFFIAILALGFSFKMAFVQAQVCGEGTPCSVDADCTDPDNFPNSTACPECFVCEILAGISGTCQPGPDCDQSVCGNGEIEQGEECDDGADNSDTAADACRTDCTEPGCGDGVVDSDEECDGGANCNANCTEVQETPLPNDDIMIQGSGGVFNCALNAQKPSSNFVTGDAMVFGLAFLASLVWAFSRSSKQI